MSNGSHTTRGSKPPGSLQPQRFFCPSGARISSSSARAGERPVVVGRHRREHHQPRLSFQRRLPAARRERRNTALAGTAGRSGAWAAPNQPVWSTGLFDTAAFGGSPTAIGTQRPNGSGYRQPGSARWVKRCVVPVRRLCSGRAGVLSPAFRAADRKSSMSRLRSKICSTVAAGHGHLGHRAATGVGEVHLDVPNCIIRAKLQ